MLQADCDTGYDFKSSKLDIYNCKNQIINCDGVLRCDKCPVEKQKSKSNIIVTTGTLSNANVAKIPAKFVLGKPIIVNK